MKKKKAKEKIRPGSLADHFHHLALLCKNDKLTLRILVEHLGVRGESLITFVLAMPFLLPIPVPGLSIVLGIVIAFVGFSIAIGKPPWLPKKALDKPISSTFMNKFLEAAVRFSKHLERFIRPRGQFLANHPWINRFNGLLIAIGGLLLMLPLPPGTNFPPGLLVVFLSVGALERDGLFIFIGYILFALNILFFGALWMLGVEGIKALFF